MKLKVVSSTVAVLLFVCILTLALNIQPVGAAISPYSPAGAVSIEPSTATVPVNQLITVKITIANITDCASLEFWIDYNPTILEYVGYTFDTDPANPLSPTQMAPSAADRVDTDVSVPGSVKLATVWKAYVPTYNYTGTSLAAEITFKGKTVGYSALQFYSPAPFYWTKADDNYGDDILFAELNNGSVRVQEAPVGGKAAPIIIPVNKPELLTPYIGLTLLLAVAVSTVVCVKKRKRNRD